MILDVEVESHVIDHAPKNHAYYLASSNVPGLIIIQVQLKDNKYIEWEKA